MPLDAGRVHQHIRILFALILRSDSIRCNCPPECSSGCGDGAARGTPSGNGRSSCELVARSRIAKIDFLALAQEVSPSKQLGAAGSTRGGQGWRLTPDRVGRLERTSEVVDGAITARLKEHAWKAIRASGTG
jgi:hypothetical protein